MGDSGAAKLGSGKRKSIVKSKTQPSFRPADDDEEREYEEDNYESEQREELGRTATRNEKLITRGQRAGRVVGEGKRIAAYSSFNAGCRTNDRNDSVGLDTDLKSLAPSFRTQYKKVSKDKDSMSKNIVMRGLRGNSFCRTLADPDLDLIFGAMQYFTFEKGQAIVKQGEHGRHFFVIQEGQLEVQVDGVHTNTLGIGSAFGAIALLYDCPRTATVVAREDSGVWGIDGDIFRRVIKEAAQKNYEENRSFLDCVTFFEGLPAAQKERVTELALVTESFEAGSRIITEGETATAVYVVKKGILRVVEGGKTDAIGNLVGGNQVSQLKAGDCLGERAVLYGERRSSTVVADGKCELVCMGVGHLQQCLGDDLAHILERSLVMATLHKMPVFSHLALSQRRCIAGAMTTRSLSVDEELEVSMQLLVVLDGDVVVGNDGEVKVTFKRGQWHGVDAFNYKVKEEKTKKSRRDSKDEKKKSTRVNTTDLQPGPAGKIVAGPNGARVAALSQQNLLAALKELGINSIRGADEAVDAMRKVLLAKKVPIFRELSESQVDGLVQSFAVGKYSKGANIIKEGDIDDTFYIVANGEVNVYQHGEKVRTLGRNACFGERALLFDERRTATVEAASEHVETWSVSRENFEAVVSQGMRSELMKRIRMQDTSVTMRSLLHARLIGAGSFGSVRLVEHRYTGLRYALKRIKKTNEGSIPEAVSREIDVLRSLDHPFILKMIAVFDQSKKSVYILTELVTGGNLYDALDQMGTTLTKKQTQFYIGSLCLVLEFIHDQSIVFRDLKPENVMLDNQGYVKLIDFGLAKKIRITGRTYTACGTLFYMAPEVIKGKGHGMAVDIWSLGVIMFDMVNGYVPFGDGAEDEQTILESILTDDLEFGEHYSDSNGMKLMRSMLKRDPQKRLGSGVQGWEEIKKHKYFLSGVDELFDRIMSRELQPPIVNAEETYTDEKDLWKMTLSDNEELGGVVE